MMRRNCSAVNRKSVRRKRGIVDQRNVGSKGTAYGDENDFDLYVKLYVKVTFKVPLGWGPVAA